MAIEIKLPRLGWSMEEGTFQGWLKKDGEIIAQGDLLFTLEGEKAAQDVESTDSGILRILPNAPQPGDVVKVGHLLGYLVAEGEKLLEEPAVSAVSEKKAEPASGAAQRPHIAPAVSVVTGRSPASPRARRAAKERHVDLTAILPTGKEGRICERNVLAAGAQAGATMREVPITSLRRAIAERMMQSLRSTAPVTLTCRCDATNLVALRTQLKSAGGSPLIPSYNDIITKLTATALQSHPMLAGRWEDDRILLPEQINIGIAVDTEYGLLVPVVRNVSGISLLDVASQSRKLIEAARERRLKSEDMQGGCFTISSLGGFGIEVFTPVINYPESAILGVGSILREPAVLDDGQIGCREQLTLSLTFDHRVVDGAPAARFLQTLRQRIENPVLCLITDEQVPKN